MAALLARKSAEYKYTQLGNPIVSPKIDKPVVAANVPAMMQRLAKEVLPNAKGYAVAVNSTEISNAIDDNAQNLIVNGFKVDDFINNMNRILKK
ncbi:hypothetical protein D3C71_1718060 [compost metagenome]